MTGHRELEVWRRAHALRVRIYHVTDGTPARGSWRLVEQIRSSSSSVPDNIAEGRGSPFRAVYRRHIAVAMASAGETDSQIIALLDEGLLSAALAFELLDDLAVVRRMLLALHRSLKERA